MSDLIFKKIPEALLDLVEFDLLLGSNRTDAIRPISVHVTRAKGEAIVEEGWIDYSVLLGSIEQVAQVA